MLALGHSKVLDLGWGMHSIQADPKSRHLGRGFTTAGAGRDTSLLLKLLAVAVACCTFLASRHILTQDPILELARL